MWLTAIDLPGFVNKDVHFQLILGSPVRDYGLACPSCVTLVSRGHLCNMLLFKGARRHRTDAWAPQGAAVATYPVLERSRLQEPLTSPLFPPAEQVVLCL